ncbi:MAG: hypothetical protein JNM88_14895 [Chitinophagaceae bacterium]|nr:hypothetical protein [Chitinophagaceae bacterium]
MPWVKIESVGLTISGIDAGGTNFGKPGYLNLLCVIFFTIFHLTPRLWAKRTNLVVVALNSAWALRNFLLIGTCRAGECPSRKIGIYLLLLASLLMLLAALFPDMKLEKKQTANRG